MIAVVDGGEPTWLAFTVVGVVIAGALLAAFALTGWLRLHDRLAGRMGVSLH